MSKSGFLKTTLGRKFAMGLSALFLMFYLLIHLGINLTAVFSAEVFNMASDFMGTNPVVQWVLQPILFFAIIFHFVMGMYMERKNNAARPIKYVKNKGSANSTWMSRNMAITGLVILAFLIVHFIDFWIPEMNHKYYHIGAMTEFDGTNYYDRLMNHFSELWRVVLYSVSFVLLSLHLLHGAGSSWQSIGVSNKFLNRKQKVWIWYATLVPLGFVFIAVALYIQTLSM